MTIDQLHGPVLHAALEVAQRLKHDLGKYITLQSRWLPPEADRPSRLDALRADLLETRRGVDGQATASDVWQHFRAQLFGEVALDGGAHVNLSEDEDVRSIDDHMTQLATTVGRLEALTDEELDRACGGAAAVAAATQRLVRRLREASRG